MRQPASPGAPSAVIIPFPRFAQSPPRKAVAVLGSPDFDLGFEFAMNLVRHLKARGQLSHLKGV
jgi:hypothetical protein